MIRNARLTFAVVFPIACLAALTAYKQVRLMAGTRVVIPIAGYDPRDLLSGHYLTFRLELGKPCISGEGEREVLLCGAVEEKVLTSVRRVEQPSADCEVVLRGRCVRGAFVTGAERFFVPEEQAVALDRAVRSGKGAVEVSVNRSGTLAVKELLIDGRSWREAIR